MGQLWQGPKLALNLKKCHKETSSGLGGRGDIGNARNNTRDSMSSTNKYYKGEIEAFGDVFALNYDKVALKKLFDVFR